MNSEERAERNSWWNDESSILLGLLLVSLSWTNHLSTLPAMPEALSSFLYMTLHYARAGKYMTGGVRGK